MISKMKTLLSLLAICVATLAIAPDAMALTEFKTEFKKKFADKHKSKDFQLAVRKASCNVCHIAKAKKHDQTEKFQSEFHLYLKFCCDEKLTTGSLTRLTR